MTRKIFSLDQLSDWDGKKPDLSDLPSPENKSARPTPTFTNGSVKVGQVYQSKKNPELTYKIDEVMGEKVKVLALYGTKTSWWTTASAIKSRYQPVEK